MTDHKADKSAQARGRFFYGYIVVSAAFLIFVVTYGTYYCFGVFFKPMINDFGWTRAMTSGALSLAMIIMGLVGVFLGGLTDKFGPRIVMTACGLISGIGYVLMSQIGSIWQLYLFYGIMIGAGLSIFVPLTSTVARWFVQRRTMMTGIITAGIGVGALIGPPVASQLISVYDWRVSFMILGVAVILVVVPAAQYLKRDPARIGEIAYGKHEAEEQRFNMEIESFSFKDAVHTRQFWMVFGLFLCFGFCLMTIMVHFVPHATDIGISASNAAMILATIGGISIVAKVAMGHVGDMIGNKQTIMIGFVLMVIALSWLLFTTDILGLYLFAVIFSVAYGNHIAQQSPVVAALFGLAAHGLILGVIGVGWTVGTALGPFVAGYIFDLTGSYQIAFLISIAVSCAGIIFTTLLKPKITKHTFQSQL